MATNSEQLNDPQLIDLSEENRDPDQDADKLSDNESRDSIEQQQREVILDFGEEGSDSRREIPDESEDSRDSAEEDSHEQIQDNCDSKPGVRDSKELNRSDIRDSSEQKRDPNQEGQDSDEKQRDAKRDNRDADEQQSDHKREVREQERSSPNAQEDIRELAERRKPDLTRGDLKQENIDRNAELVRESKGSAEKIHSKEQSRDSSEQKRDSKQEGEDSHEQKGDPKRDNRDASKQKSDPKREVREQERSPNAQEDIRELPERRKPDLTRGDLKQENIDRNAELVREKIHSKEQSPNTRRDIGDSKEQSPNSSHDSRDASESSLNSSRNSSDLDSISSDAFGSYEVEPGVRCSILCKNGQLIEKPRDPPGIDTVWDAFQRGVSTSAKGQCLGWREGNIYKWLTYQEVADQVYNLSAALSNTEALKRQDLVGIYAASSPKWVIASLACAARSLTVVPLYNNFNADICEPIIKETKLSLVFADTSRAARRILSKAKSLPTLKTLVTFTEPDDVVEKLAEENKVQLFTLEKFISVNLEKPSEAEKEVDLPKAEDKFGIFYTAGTTDAPKGVITTHKAVLATVAALDRFFDKDQTNRPNPNYVAFGLVPLAHPYGQVILTRVLFRGSSIGFPSGDFSNILEDAQILKPTYLPMIGQFAHKLYAKIMGEVSGGMFRSKIFSFAYQRKREAVLRGEISQTSMWDTIAFRKMQALLGGRVKFASVGDSPVLDSVLEFWRVVFGVHIIEEYGTAEALISQLDGHPLPNNYVKLIDAPEVGFHSAEGRGEVCIKGPNVMEGYYNRPERTREVLDEEGWLRTGDLAKLAADGSLKILGRKNTILKLANGERILPERIESAYLLSPEVGQVFVDANNSETYPVAVVVPEPAKAEQYASQHGVDKNTLPNNAEYKKFILDALTAVGTEHKLSPVEQVKAICLTDEEFSVINRQQTPTMKNNRPELRRHFKEKIDTLYKTGSAVKLEEASTEPTKANQIAA